MPACSHGPAAHLLIPFGLQCIEHRIDTVKDFTQLLIAKALGAILSFLCIAHSLRVILVFVVPRWPASPAHVRVSGREPVVVF